jgi:hypothetical protein
MGLSRGDRRLLLWGGGVFLALVGLAALVTTGAGDTTEHPSTYSAGATGAKAAYLLLQSSGYSEERWEQPLDELANASTTTLILAEPSEAPTAGDRRSIQRFLEGGGRLIATGPIGASFLDNAASLDPVAGLTWTRVAAASPSALARAAPEITLAPQASWGRPGFAVPLYGTRDAPMVVHFTAGSGEAYWWAAATPLTNAGLTAPGNLEFFLASLGRAGERRVLWDEYVHGHRRSLGASVWRSPLKWLLLQLAVFALAILATYSRRSGPIMRPAVESRLSPLEFVRTLGSLYQRAGAAPVAVDMSYQRFRYWLTRRAGVPHNASPEEIERAVHGRWGVDSAALGSTLRACESARQASRLDAKAALALIRSLGNYAAVLRLFHVSSKESR